MIKIAKPNLDANRTFILCSIVLFKISYSVKTIIDPGKICRHLICEKMKYKEAPYGVWREYITKEAQIRCSFAAQDVYPHECEQDHGQNGSRFQKTPQYAYLEAQYFHMLQSQVEVA